MAFENSKFVADSPHTRARPFDVDAAATIAANGGEDHRERCVHAGVDADEEKDASARDAFAGRGAS